MNWRIILNVYFICSVTSSWVPENHDQQSSDVQSNQTSRSIENASETNNSYKVEGLFEDKDLLDIPNNNDCFSSIDMKRTIVVILESVRRNPDVLDNLIGKLKSEVDQEPGLFDNRRSILLQLQLPDQYNPNQLDTSSQCAKLITELAKTAHKTYINFRDSPTCRKFLLPENEDTVVSNLQAKDPIPDVNTMIASILKEMRQYNDLHSNIKQKPDKNSVTVPDIYLQDWHIVNPTMSVNSTTDELVYQPSPGFGYPFGKRPFVTENKPLSDNIPKSQIQQHSSFTPLKLSHYKMPSFAEHDMPVPMPESSVVSKPNPFPIQTLQPIMPSENSSPVISQDLHTPIFNGIKPQEHMSHILEPITTELPIFGNFHDLSKTYPNIIEQPQNPGNLAPKIIFKDVYDDNKHYVNVPPNAPIHDVSNSFYGDPHSIYPTAQQPFYMDTTPIFPKLNIVNLILQLITSKPSLNQIMSIRNALEQNVAVFEPKIYKALIALLNSYEEGLVDNNKVYEIYKFLLLSHPNNLWSEEKQDLFWRLLQPDETGQVNPKNIDLIVSLVHPWNKSTLTKDPNKVGMIFTLLNQNKKEILRPDQKQVLLSLIELAKNDMDNSKYINIVKTLANWDEIPYLTSEYIDVIFSLLRSASEGMMDTRPVDIINQIILQKKQNILTTDDVAIIFSFLKPDANGNVNSKRLDIVVFILNNTSRIPQLRNSIIQLLDTDVTKSKYIDIILALYRERILSIQLLEALITLLKQERTGYIDDYIINKIFMLLAPYKNRHPKIIADIFRQLRTTRSLDHKSALTDYNTNAISMPDNTKTWLYDSPNINTQQQLLDFKLASISPPRNPHNWAEYNPNVQKSTLNNNLLFNLLHMPLRDRRETLDKYGFIELTYMINNQIPIYRPVYYVKYKIPMDKFLTNINAQNPQLSANPIMVLQKLIIEGNVSEVSPTLKGLNKEDILKLTFKDGDLIQAKLLDKSSLSLHDQLKILQKSNAIISPQNILEQNDRNSAQLITQIEGNKGRPSLEYLKNMPIINAVSPQMKLKRPITPYVWYPNQKHRGVFP